MPRAGASLERGRHAHRARSSLPPGEATNPTPLAQVCDAVLAARIERGDLVVALGGGVVGDLAGFAARSAARRALRPGPDHAAGPGRLLGRRQDRHQLAARQEPRRRLPPAEAGAGRHGAARHAAAARDARRLRRGGEVRPHRRRRASSPGWRPTGAASSPAGPSATRRRRACRAKAAIVARDESETGDRALLNLGHTFGHALERMTGYDATRLRAWRGRRHRPGARLPRSRRAWASARRRTPARVAAASAPRRACRRGSREVAGRTAAPPTPGRRRWRRTRRSRRGALTFILARGIGKGFIARGVDRARGARPSCAERQPDAGP